MKLNAIMSVLILLALAYLPVKADDSETEKQEKIKIIVDRFRIFGDCRPIYLVVEDFKPVVQESSFNKVEIQTVVDNLLRSARLHTNEMEDAFLHIQINLVAGAANVNVTYQKNVMDITSGIINYATTWSNGFTIPYGKDGWDPTFWLYYLK